MAEGNIIFAGRDWEPLVRDQDGQLVFELPVERGFASMLFYFSITSDHLAVLKSDQERYYFLFSLLHSIYQSKNPATVPNTDKHFDLVLFGDNTAVERLLTKHDKDSNGAVSNGIRIFMNRDMDRMRNGQWFAAKPGS